ncbi:MAG TPA: Asp-tRNA(Asn)/Glu-tRNA(Gln) amidotransferase subunit GatB [Solirubrobacteraceae bacterium]|nr:Asp-tRNA(Asn)/Glu-tRNA(Gln) amidotransferase subunit GatB [Solirubrobacteraceae bacterium]
MTAYEAVIGLEIHVQLATATKMFCGCELSFGDEPNVHTCPVCLGLPGSLPVLNARAVHFGTMIGLALGSEIARRSLFHRKNYFYPDLPKGYQISQYDVPLCLGGQLGEIRIHRVHLEEDAAKLEHVGESGRIHGADQTIVDFNRGGTPLVEIVTEPDFRSPAQAREWLTLLRATLKALAVSDVDMSQGSLRCDANVSIRPEGSTELGTKTELKNMNSFRFLEDGVRAEIERQTALLDAGEAVVQQTIHFDPRTGRLSALRSKEEAHDYRYFPEPDLVPLEITDGMLEAALSELPELPGARAERFEREYALGPERSHLLAFRTELGDYYERALSEGDRVDPVELANWIPLLVERIGSDSDPSESNVSPGSLAALARMVGAKEVSRGNARDVLGTLVREGGDPRRIVEDKGLGAIAGDDGDLGAAIDAAIAADPGAAEQVRGGNAKALGPLIAAVMRETKGRADGGEVRKLLLGRIGAS